jgi:hypothetical protein
MPTRRLLEIEEELAERPIRQLWLDEGRFVAKIEFDEELVERLRGLPIRRYDRARKRWIVPPIPEAADSLLTIAESYQFTVSEQVFTQLARIGTLYRQIQTDPRLRSVERYLYRAPDYETLISIPEHHGIADEIKGLLGAIWDQRIGAFRLESTARTADMILNVAGEYDFFVEPAEYERLASMGNLLFDEDDFTYFPLSSADRILYRMLIRLPKLRRENLFDAVRSYRHI